jgi:hypothetical protein
LYGVGATITDSGSLNTWEGVYNWLDGTRVNDQGRRRRANISIGNGGTANINLNEISYAEITANGAAITIAAPTNVTDGQDLDITIHNAHSGAITITWNAVFKTTGFVSPASGYYKSIRFRYSATYNFWTPISMTVTDIANS